MTTAVVALEHVPGALSALEAVQYAGGVLLTAYAAEQLVVAALYASDAEVRAAAFADAADILTEYAQMFGTPGFLEAGQLLDNMSALMRTGTP
jgi:siroheme synthase